MIILIWSFFLVLAELVNFQPTGKIIYKQKFGQLDDDSPLINKFIDFIPALSDYDSGNPSVGKIQFIYSGYDDLLFVLCADRTDDIVPLVQALENMKVAFSQKFMNFIKEGKDDPSLFRTFRNDIENALSSVLISEKTTTPIEETPPAPTEEPAPSLSSIEKKMIKVAFVGDANVGKRTLLSLLLSGPQHNETKSEETEMIMKKGAISDKYDALLITLPNSMIEAGKTQFLSNTDVILLVNASVFKDVMATRKIYETIKPILPNSHYGVIANKQDIAGAVDIDAIKKVYELPTIDMIAIDASYYDKLKDFVERLIEGTAT